jgi:hypothetical protein
MAERPTAMGTYYGVQTGPYAPGGSEFSPTGCVGKGFSPDQFWQQVPVGYGASGKVVTTACNGDFIRKYKCDAGDGATDCAE